MTASINLKERDVVGSAKRIFALIHTNPKWGVIEGMLNSMTAMRNNTSKKEIYITLKVGNSCDTQWEDYGTGIWKEKWDTIGAMITMRFLNSNLSNSKAS